MSEARITNLSNESNTGGPTISGITTFSGTNYFVPPVGNTAQRPENPEKGAIRFNTDSKHLEYYKGETIGWSEVEATVEGDGSARGIFMGGYNPFKNHLQNKSIISNATAIDFGDLGASYKGNAGCSSRTRALSIGGYNNNQMNVIEYVEIMALGNAVDWGDLPAVRSNATGVSNGTRGIVGGFAGTPAYLNTIEYLTFTSVGSVKDFGDLTTAGGNGSRTGCQSTTRGIFPHRDDAPAAFGGIQYVTMATLGNAVTFGTLLQGSFAYSGCSNATRGIMSSSSPVSVTMEYLTIATLGDALDFGDLTAARWFGTGVSSSTRAMFGGGSDPSNTDTTVCDKVEIATIGNAVDWGDLAEAVRDMGAASNAHGGLS
jgi:hypothetical protein